MGQQSAETTNALPLTQAQLLGVKGREQARKDAEGRDQAEEKRLSSEHPEKGTLNFDGGRVTCSEESRVLFSFHQFTLSH